MSRGSSESVFRTAHEARVLLTRLEGCSFTSKKKDEDPESPFFGNYSVAAVVVCNVNALDVEEKESSPMPSDQQSVD